MSNRRRLIVKNRRDFSNKRKIPGEVKLIAAIVSAIVLGLGLFLWLRIENTTETAEEETAPIVEEQPEKVYEPVEGGQLQIAVSRFSSFDPYKNHEKSMDNFFRLVYDSLFELDSSYNLVPELATEYTIGSDGKILTITIASGAKWHDNQRVTAADVRFTINHIKANPDSPYYRLVQNIAQVSASGSRVTIELTEPDSLAIYNMVFPIITQRSLSASGVLSDGSFTVIGNGMFYPVEYTKGKEMLLKKFDGYHLQKPYITEIKAHIYTDSVIRKNMFAAKSVDLIESSYHELSRYEYDVFRTSYYQSRKFDLIAFNSKKEPFVQSYNRKLIAKILDTQTEIDALYRGEINRSFFPLYKDGDPSPLNVELYDKEAIREFQFVGTPPSRLKIITDKSDPVKSAVASYIKSQLSLAGIDADVAGLTPEELKAALSAGAFDIGVFSYEIGIDRDISDLLNKSEILFGYPRETFDSLMQSVYKQGNPTFRNQNYQLAQEELLKMMPFIGLGFRREYVVYNERVKGELTPTDIELYNGIEKIFIIEELTPSA